MRILDKIAKNGQHFKGTTSWLRELEKNFKEPIFLINRNFL